MTNLQIIFALIFALILIAQTFVLLFIWRAILGKTTIEAKLGTQIVILEKSITKLTTTTDKSTQIQSESVKQLREVSRNLKDLR